MKMLFYEIFNKAREAEYFAHRRPPERISPRKILHQAHRVWSWDLDTDIVSYIKNRDVGIMKEVDRNEFLIVQLKATEYRVSDEI